MNRIIISEKICLEPRELNTLQKSLYEKITKKLEGKCDQSYGFILKIYDNIQIIDNTVSNTNAGVFFTVSFTIQYLKPVVGNCYEGTVCLVTPKGIFVDVDKVLKVLIPLTKLQNYEYRDGSFISKSSTLTKNSKVSLVIDMLCYEKQNFSCIGSLKDNNIPIKCQRK